jgi:hypothetical protein
MQHIEHADFHLPCIFAAVQQSYGLLEEILLIIQFEGMHDPKVQRL